MNFVSSIWEQITAPRIGLSKKQRDTTDEILMQASSGDPPVFLEGQLLVDLAKLIRHATGDDGRVSSPEENVMASLKRGLDELATAASGEPAMAVSGKQWRIVEEIRQKTRFRLPGEPPPIDPDGLVENEDPDSLPPERDETEFNHARDWSIVGMDDDEDCQTRGATGAGPDAAGRYVAAAPPRVQIFDAGRAVIAFGPRDGARCSSH